MTKFGNNLNKAILSTATKLDQCNILYYILQFTWGLIPNIVGLLSTLILMIFKKKPKKFYRSHYVKVGKLWGGMSLGISTFVDNYPSKHTLYHEYGHSFQNAILGPFWIFLVAIPSFIRYWIFEIRYKKGKSNPPYDSIWFEHNATEIGEMIMRRYEKSS